MTIFLPISASRRTSVASASRNPAWSLAMLASACAICAFTSRSSRRKRMSFSLTRSPSLNRTSTICPSTRVLTATLANGSTVPGATRMTGMSEAITVAAVTGAGGARPLPSPFLATALDVSDDAGTELVLGRIANTYARPTPMVAPATYTPSRLAFIYSTATPAPRRPDSPGHRTSGGPQAQRYTRAGTRFARGLHARKPSLPHFRLNASGVPYPSLVAAGMLRPTGVPVRWRRPPVATGSRP